MKRVALGLLGEPAVSDMARLAARAEDLGYDSIWLTETRFTRDAITTAAAVGVATRSVKIGTGVVNAYTRGTVLTAVTVPWKFKTALLEWSPMCSWEKETWLRWATSS